MKLCVYLHSLNFSPRQTSPHGRNAPIQTDCPPLTTVRERSDFDAFGASAVCCLPFSTWATCFPLGTFRPGNKQKCCSGGDGVNRVGGTGVIADLGQNLLSTQQVRLQITITKGATH